MIFTYRKQYFVMRYSIKKVGKITIARGGELIDLSSASYQYQEVEYYYKS